MSHHIPFEIQVEIIKRLPVKPLIRSRILSKTWKSLIDSSEFYADYIAWGRHAHQQQHLLIKYGNGPYCEQNYISIMDDDTFPQHKFSVTGPPSVKLLRNTDVVGSSHGLLCLFGYYYRDDSCCDSMDSNDDFEHHDRTSMAVIWNPTIRKTVVIAMSEVIYEAYDMGPVFGFGVCPYTNDPKLVRINEIILEMPREFESLTCSNWQAEVYTLSSGVWRSTYSNMPNKWFDVIWFCSPTNLGSFIYWVAHEKISWDNGCDVLISFDLVAEEFNVVYLPDELGRRSETDKCIRIYELRGSLAVVQHKKAERQVFNVWMMENDVSKSFTKLFTINLPCGSVKNIVGFRKNYDGDDDDEPAVLVAYRPKSKHVNNLVIYGEVYSFFMSSYIESLLLYDQPDWPH